MVIAEPFVGSSVRWNKVWLPLILAVAGLAALALDLPLGQWSLNNELPDPLDKWLKLSEVFAHGIGVATILVSVAILDAGKWHFLPRMIAASFGAGLFANVFKLALARVRPHSFAFESGVAETFTSWFPFASAGSQFQGFPSAHAATAVGLAMALTWRYPHARNLFAVLAISASCQRVISGDHFASDVIWGAAMGAFCAAGFLDGGLFARWFDRMEARLVSLRNPAAAAVVQGRLTADGSYEGAESVGSDGWFKSTGRP